ncbi:antibiotic biosynthesis monooxygenase family protein [Flammeovirga pacifica]|uniref:Antibiotic biosynthesis monooxygenase n=1 Tax=Flammeovirga pacifica TaxID=915059 RepID=A0A1S1Z4M0_FLAPC|nr:antibiotic biosynthesis monooxygenase [Flammeovirga pacifica]OHX68103.1 antibiotic biosynthesis monooxygenase [Flammeovirga pacifica]
MIAKTPTPPYYAVIFTNIRTNIDDGYGITADHMVEMAKKQEGFLGIESARDGLGITISYWTDLASIKKWKENSAHLTAQKMGKDKWYEQYTTRIALVEREYSL